MVESGGTVGWTTGVPLTQVKLALQNSGSVGSELSQAGLQMGMQSPPLQVEILRSQVTLQLSHSVQGQPSHLFMHLLLTH